MPTIASVPELYLDEIVEAGVTRNIYLHMRVVLEGGDPDGEWHYFGTEVPPEHEGATEHSYVHFPSAVLDMGDEDQDLFYDLGYLAARGQIEA